MADQQPIKRTFLGSGIYTQSLLPLFYQSLVLGFNFRYAWKCPVDVLLPFFLENFSKKHMDCGVANGYFCAEGLSHSSTTSDQHITLVDLSPGSLEFSRKFLLSRAPETDIQCVKTDIREPVPDTLAGEKFKSITMFNLFHCVPGEHKFHQAFKHYSTLLAPDGTLSGCTILGKSSIHNVIAWVTMVLYNWLGIFDNWNDTKEEIEDALNKEFSHVETRVVGMVLLFKARSKT